jgi:hypothetical protein
MTTTENLDTRHRYDCPPWCVRSDHDADEVGPGSPPNHYAEDIGSCGPQSDGFSTEVIVHLAGEAVFVSDPDELRRVGADMFMAAQWLEEHK